MKKIFSSKEIGWKLRKLRLQAGWTQERLSEQIGVSVQQIQNYESGANKMNTDRLQQLANALDVPVHPSLPIVTRLCRWLWKKSC